MIDYFKQVLRLTTTTTAKNLYWMFAGNLVSIVVAFVATIIIARFITRAEYGVYLTLFSFSTLVAELSDLGINTSLSIFFPKLQKQRKHEQIKIIYATAFNLELIIGLSVLGLSLILLPILEQTIFINVSRLFLIITIGETFLVQLTAFSTMTQAAYQKFKEFAFVTMFFGICRLVLLMVLWYLNKVNLLNILLIQLMSSLLSVLFAQIFQRYPCHFRNFNFTNIAKIFRYSGYMGVTKMLAAIANRLDLLMLLPLAGATAAGVYGVASRIAQIYPFLLTGFGQVLAPKMASYEGREVLPFLKKSFLVVTLFLVSLLIFYICARPLILFLFGHSYLESISIFQGLLLATIGYVLSLPFTTLLIYTYRKPQLMTLFVLIQLIIISLGNLTFIPQYGGFGPIYSIGLANAVLFLLSGLMAWKYLKQ